MVDDAIVGNERVGGEGFATPWPFRKSMGGFGASKGLSLECIAYGIIRTDGLLAVSIWCHLSWFLLPLFAPAALSCLVKWSVDPTTCTSQIC